MGQQIRLHVIRSGRKTLALQITREGEAVVRAPYLASDESIQRFVREHLDWLVRHTAQNREKAARKAPPFSEDEIHRMVEFTRQFLPALIQEYSERLQVCPGRITVRNQRTRWGSCSSQGSLNFNCLLAQAPDQVRRYVVLHELCHLKEMNHSPAFWRLVASQMPDYQRAKEWLKTEGQRLIERLG